MTEAFVSIGSNIKPAENVRQAIHLLARQVDITGISTVYRTPAIGRPEQPHYFNCVVRIQTDLGVRELKQRVLRTIEDDLGRRRVADKYASRTIDLDLILYGDLEVAEPDLVLPDPQIASRPFIAIPLHELAPQLTLPGGPGPGMPVAEVVASMADRPRKEMEQLADYTELLRREVLGQG